MATLNISQDDALRGFKAVSDISSGQGSKDQAPQNPLSNLKNYVLGTGGPAASTGLPFAYKDAAHTTTGTPGNENSAPFMSWPTWASVSAPSPWYETLGLSRTQRYAAFGLCFGAASLLLLVSFFRLPLSVLFPTKFVLPFCFANLFLFVSFGFLHGFGSYGRHLISRERWPFTAFFFGSTLATLYVAYGIQFYPVTLVFAVIQGIASASYIISYVPGGSAGLGFIGSSIRAKVTGGL
jgi:hypothetical protein